MSKVIITGAGGFIGSALVNKFIEKETEVIAIDVNFSDENMTNSKFVTKVKSSLDNIDELMNYIPIDEYDAFYHFAWRGVNGPDKANPVVQLQNAELAMNCATLAKNIGCKKFLCAGTVAEQATHSLSNLYKTSGGMIYGVAKHCTHLMLETYCKNIGLQFVWMQFSNIYGPNNKTGNLVSYTIGEIKKGQEATFGPALQPYDFIYVDDLIEAVMRLGKLDTKKNFYFIGSGEPRLLKDYLFEIGEKNGTPELIKVGIRPDDGIIYTMDMFNVSDLKDAIGNYISMNFSEAIKFTLDNY